MMKLQWYDQIEVKENNRNEITMTMKINITTIETSMKPYIKW